MQLSFVNRQKGQNACTHGAGGGWRKGLFWKDKVVSLGFYPSEHFLWGFFFSFSSFADCISTLTSVDLKRLWLIVYSTTVVGPLSRKNIPERYQVFYALLLSWDKRFMTFRSTFMSSSELGSYRLTVMKHLAALFSGCKR